MRYSFALSVLVTLSGCIRQPMPASPQSTSTSAIALALTSTIASLDSALFAAFNAHDAVALGTWFTTDLEFYHDKTGLAGYDSTMASFRGLFSRNAETGLRREIVSGTLEVHPIGDFGLLEVCQHRFCHTENGHEDCGTFKNIMVWRKEGASYKVCRVISYDH